MLGMRRGPALQMPEAKEISEAEGLRYRCAGVIGVLGEAHLAASGVVGIVAQRMHRIAQGRGDQFIVESALLPGTFGEVLPRPDNCEILRRSDSQPAPEGLRLAKTR